MFVAADEPEPEPEIGVDEEHEPEPNIGDREKTIKTADDKRISKTKCKADIGTISLSQEGDMR